MKDEISKTDFTKDALSEKEESNLSKRLSDIEIEQRQAWGLHRISGGFVNAEFDYVEDDKIYFYNMPKSNHSRIHIETKTGNPYNAECMTVPVQKNKLILFPSWLEHGVDLNESATTDRISLAFNVFARGTLGAKGTTSELIV